MIDLKPILLLKMLKYLTSLLVKIFLLLLSNDLGVSLISTYCIYRYKRDSSINIISLEDLADIREYILRGFTINFSNTKVIDQFMDKQNKAKEDKYEEANN